MRQRIGASLTDTSCNIREFTYGSEGYALQMQGTVSPGPCAKLATLFYAVESGDEGTHPMGWRSHVPR